MSNLHQSCAPLSKVGADYVRELIAPSGSSNCDGPPDGSDNGAAAAKTRDQVVISRPTWFPDSSWDFVTFVTPYYAQQVVVAAFPTGNDAAEVRQWVRFVVNSIPASAWWNGQLPSWHNPQNYNIFNDAGALVVVPFPLALGFICPRILRSLFAELSPDAQITTMVREVRRWGRYVTIAPVANATQMKGRLISSSLQFNGALNPHVLAPVSTEDMVPDPDDSARSILTPMLTHDQPGWARYDNGAGTETRLPVGPAPVVFSDTYPWAIYTSTGVQLLTAGQMFRVIITLSGGELYLTWSNPLTGEVLMAASGPEPVTFNLRVNFALLLNEPVVDSQWLARLSTTPDFSFPALQQADDKSYTNGFIEGCTARVGFGKDHLDYVATREWRPLVRVPPAGVVAQHLSATKFDLVDPSGKWQVIYATAIDPAASFSLILGAHYQFCSETDQLFQLFKRPPTEYDCGALDLARELQTKLPHSYPAAFNDGGILPSLLGRVVRAGITQIGPVVNTLANSLLGSLQSIGTADRVIGYPNQYVAMGGNAVSGLQTTRPTKAKRKGNGNGQRAKLA